jgi:hypothetical protein
MVWAKVSRETAFYYGGVPTGIATRPEAYEAWEFSHPDRHDLAAMGRVWYLESWARFNMRDGSGIVDTLRKVAELGRDNGWHWRERYYAGKGSGYQAAGPNTYCEYPANLIRIVNRFLLGIEFGLDSSLTLAPVVPDEFWDRGFGAQVNWARKTLKYRMQRGSVSGFFQGDRPFRLKVRLDRRPLRARVNGRQAPLTIDDSLAVCTLPPATEPVTFDIRALA